MIKLITLISEIKQVGGGDLQKFVSLIKKYNSIIEKLNDLKDTYKRYQWGYSDRFNKAGSSGGEGAKINNFHIPRKKDINNLDLAFHYRFNTKPFEKIGVDWMKDSGAIRNMTQDLKYEFEALKNEMKHYIKDYYQDKYSNNYRHVDPSIVALKKIYQDDLGGEEILGELDQTEDQDLARMDADSESTIFEYDVLAGGENEDDEYYANKDFWGGGLDEIQNLSTITWEMFKELFNKYHDIRVPHSVRYYMWEKLKKDIKKKYNIHHSTLILRRIFEKLPPQGKMEFYKRLKELVENPPEDADDYALADDPRLEEFYTDDLGGEEIYGS